MCALLSVSVYAAVRNVYVNPLKNSAGVNEVVAKRLYKKALLGLTKAKTIAAASGPDAVAPGSPEAQNYDYILTFVLRNATTEEAGTIGNLMGALSSSKKDPDWSGKLTTDVIIVDAKTGNKAFETTLEPSGTDKDKANAIFKATNHFDYDVTDMTDDAFRISGEILEATDVDKKGIVKKVRAQIGSENGARKNQLFEIYKVQGDNCDPIGMAKCEQVLNGSESVLSIMGKKNGDQVISDLIQNGDGSYTIMAQSRSKTGFLHNNFQGIDKMFTNEGRPSYLDPYNRTSKPKVGFLAVEINDNAFSSQKDNFQNQVVKGMSNVPTINLVKTIYPEARAALNDGVDGLIEVTIDKVNNTTEKTKEGKTNYMTEILFTVSGYDVANDKWIDMKSFSRNGSSTESAEKAKEGALALVDTDVQKYSEDLFPVAASIVNSVEVKKEEVKKVLINVGTDMGVKKGMAFDIYEQRSEGGADSRFLLGTGKVEKEGLKANEAVLKVKGKNDGDKKLYELLKNMDENTSIVLVSKASYDILQKGMNFLNRDK